MKRIILCGVFSLLPMMTAYADDAACPGTLPRHTTCKNNKLYCGETPVDSTYLNENWGCINGKWVCTSSVCSCGNEKVGKFGHCEAGKAFCGTTAQPIPWIFDENREYSRNLNSYGFICQNNTWVCASPGGCSISGHECLQFQTYKDGKCVGNDVRPKVSVQECINGDCPCGKGHCPMHALCVDGECICGKPQLSNELSSVSVSSDYGDFACAESLADNECLPDSYSYGLLCLKPNGCKRSDGKILRNKADIPDNVINDVKEGKPISPFYASDLIDVKSSEADNKRILAKLEDLELSKCGRKTAEEMKRNISDEPKPSDVMTPYNFRCDIRYFCDTMPIPRAERKDYQCVVRKYRSMTCDAAAHDFKILGLRCTNSKGCACFDDKCSKGQYCFEGVCIDEDDLP